MQSVSATYAQILTDVNHWFEYKIRINGIEYLSDTLRSVKTELNMLDEAPELGKAVAGEIDVEMLNPAEYIPKMAKIEVFARACNASSQSEWLPQGVFRIDTRKRSKTASGLSILSLHGYDDMLKAEQMYNGRITGDSTDIQMVNEIAYQMGVNVDARTTAMVTNGYTIPFPVGYTYREILGYIASMYAGCFIMSDSGELRLVSLSELPPETNHLITKTGEAITFGGVRILV